jgi:hypothetical protein
LGRKSGSYKFEKRQKELKKQKKKREKLERRLNKGGDADEEPQPTGWIGGTFDEDDDSTPDDEFDSDDEDDRDKCQGD